MRRSSSRASYTSRTLAWPRAQTSFISSSSCGPQKAAYNAGRRRDESPMTTQEPLPRSEDDAPTAQVRRPKNVAELDPPSRLLLGPGPSPVHRSEEHTSELQSPT